MLWSGDSRGFFCWVIAMTGIELTDDELAQIRDEPLQDITRSGLGDAIVLLFGENEPYHAVRMSGELLRAEYDGQYTTTTQYVKEGDE